MTDTDRRGFLQTSAATAASLALGPIGTGADGHVLPLRAPSPNERVLARPVPLAKVRLTGGPLKHAQESAGKYLLELEPDRMMAYYRVRAGLPPKAQGYPSAAKQLTPPMSAEEPRPLPA